MLRNGARNTSTQRGQLTQPLNEQLICPCPGVGEYHNSPCARSLLAGLFIVFIIVPGMHQPMQTHVIWVCAIPCLQNVLQIGAQIISMPPLRHPVHAVSIGVKTRWRGVGGWRHHIDRPPRCVGEASQETAHPPADDTWEGPWCHLREFMIELLAFLSTCPMPTRSLQVRQHHFI